MKKKILCIIIFIVLFMGLLFVAENGQEYRGRNSDEQKKSSMLVAPQSKSLLSTAFAFRVETKRGTRTLLQGMAGALVILSLLLLTRLGELKGYLYARRSVCMLFADYLLSQIYIIHQMDGKK